MVKFHRSLIWIFFPNLSQCDIHIEARTLNCLEYPVSKRTQQKRIIKGILMEKNFKIDAHLFCYLYYFFSIHFIYWFVKLFDSGVSALFSFIKICIQVSAVRCVFQQSYRAQHNGALSFIVISKTDCSFFFKMLFASIMTIGSEINKIDGTAKTAWNPNFRYNAKVINVFGTCTG